MSPFVGRVVAGCRLRAVRCRSLSSTSALPVRPCKWQREERARVLREKLESDPNVLRVAIDCSLNSYYSMNEKELRSLVRQIRESYSAVLRCPQPCRLHLVGVEEGGPVDEALKQHFPGYGSKNFVMEFSSKPLYEEFPRKDLVYLSAYSSNVLQELRCDEVYAIGGVVDKFRRIKRLTEHVASNMVIPTARLPIKEHLVPPPKGSIMDLPLDQVIKMLLAVHCDGDWSNSVQQHFPLRKQ